MPLGSEGIASSHLRAFEMLEAWMNQTNSTRVLLISNSTLYGSGYLNHAESEIRDFLGKVKTSSILPVRAL